MNKKFVISVIITALCFATMEVALKIGGAKFDTLQLTFLRFFIAGVCLLPTAISQLKKKHLKVGLGDYVYMWFIGTLLICLSMTAFQEATKYSNANLVAISISTNPVFVFIFAHFLAGERFTKRKGVVLALSLAGLVLAANPFEIIHGNTPFGIMLLIFVPLTFGLYGTLAKKTIRKFGGLPQLAISFILGSLSLLAVILFKGGPVISGITIQTLPVLIYVAVVVTGIGYFFYFRAIDEGGSANGSIAFFVKPVLAPIISLAVLGEPITWNMALGICFLVSGSVITMMGNRKA